jgi:hypothetical protein
VVHPGLWAGAGADAHGGFGLLDWEPRAVGMRLGLRPGLADSFVIG